MAARKREGTLQRVARAAHLLDCAQIDLARAQGIVDAMLREERADSHAACERLMDLVTHSRRAWKMLGGSRALELAIAEAAKPKARRTRARGRRAGA